MKKTKQKWYKSELIWGSSTMKQRAIAALCIALFIGYVIIGLYWFALSNGYLLWSTPNFKLN